MLEFKGRTILKSPLENELYLELIGAKKTSLESNGRPVYQYRDLLFSTDREYRSIYCESSIYGQSTINYDGESYVIDNDLEEFVLETDEEKKLFGSHFYRNHIVSLEGLVYTFAKIYHKDNFEEYYNETLASLKVQALLNTFKNLDSSSFNNLNNCEQLAPTIDALARVMNMSTEEISEFPNVFLFNTTGVYEKEDSNNHLKFFFYTPDEKNYYEIISNGNGSWDFYTSVTTDGYLGIKIRNGKMYVTKMKNYESCSWDLVDNKTIKSCFINDSNRPWTDATSEELHELEDIVFEINNSTSLIGSVLKDENAPKKQVL